MSSATVSSSASANHNDQNQSRKPSFSRYTSAPPLIPAQLQPQQDQDQDQDLQRQQSTTFCDGSPQSSNCSSPDGSRSSSRRRDSFGSIKEDVDGTFP